MKFDFFFAVESVVTYAGERFDVIVNADQDKALYWIKYKGLMDCDERFQSVFQVAVLEYANAKTNGFPNDTVDYQHSHKEGLVSYHISILIAFEIYFAFFKYILFSYFLLLFTKCLNPVWNVLSKLV